MTRKPKILWMNEASFLSTGYGVYGNEILHRLHDTGKYEIAEMGVYSSSNDPLANNLPWLYYGCLPDTPEQNVEYNSQLANQWGLWRFEEVCLDFKPDIVIDTRDWWAGEFVSRSPFRRFFHWSIMPTVDSAPQMEQWLATYLDADSLCTYTEFGRDTLNTETNGKIKFRGIPSPSANYNIFKPVGDKQKHKELFGLDGDVCIVGTIMRNQKRKLYPDLILAFKKFLEQSHRDISDKVYLYLHTSYPDIGWDIPRLIRESGIGHRILCTYICSNCGHVCCSVFNDATQVCRQCHRPTAKLPSVSHGVSTKDLAAIINLFDVYVQYAIAEGLGMPAIEAASCGVPVMAVDYSGMASVLKNIQGIPIKVQRFFRESETHAYRALPDNQDLADKLSKFFTISIDNQRGLGRQTAIACRQAYSWEKAVNIWENIIDGVVIKPLEQTWDSPPRVITPNLNIPNNLTQDEFVRWCVVNVWGEPSQLNSYVVMRMVRDLHYGEAISGFGGPYYSEDSLIIEQPKYRTFDKQEVLGALKKMGDTRNYWEERRAGLVQVDTPIYIQRAHNRVKHHVV
jgi:glycosyltransferase involved in cell wall biosynthesis